MVRVLILLAAAGLSFWCFARAREARTLAAKLGLLAAPPAALGGLAALAESALLGASAGALLLVLLALAWAGARPKPGFREKP